MTRHRRRAFSYWPAAAAIALATALTLNSLAESNSALEVVRLQTSDLDGKGLRPVATVEPHVTLIEGSGSGAVEVPRYKSVDGLLEASVKKYERITLELRNWPIDEVMYFVKGNVELTDASGKSQVYGPGDAIVIPRGFSGRWRQLNSIEMFTVTYGVWK